jgi:hypothetical protein
LRVVQDLLDEIGHLAAGVGDALGFFIEFLAEFVGPAARGILGAR